MSNGDTYRIYDKKDKVGAEIGGDVVYTTKSNFTVASGTDILIGGGKFSVLGDYYSGTEVTTEFSEINTRPLYIQIPIKVGYNISLGKNAVLTPNIGIYGKYAFAAIKSNVALAHSTEKEKWNCFKDYNNGTHHIEAFRRFSYGLSGNINLVLNNHYSLAFEYKYGLSKLSSQYGMKEKSVSISIGYIW